MSKQTETTNDEVQFEAGDMVRVSGQDDVGDFSFTGQITRIGPTRMTILTMEGTRAFTVPEVSIEKGRKPKGFDDYATPLLESGETLPKAPERKPEREPTKKERAQAIVEQHAKKTGKEMTRQEALDAFQKELEMSQAGASTYWNLIRKSA